MASLFQRRTQFAVVVDFAVECDPDRVVFVRHGLAAAAGIDYGQSAMAQTDRTVNQNAGAVRPAMNERIPHRRQLRLVHAAVQAAWDGDAADSTHDFRPFSSENAFVPPSGGCGSNVIHAVDCERRLKAELQTRFHRYCALPPPEGGTNAFSSLLRIVHDDMWDSHTIRAAFPHRLTGPFEFSPEWNKRAILRRIVQVCCAWNVSDHTAYFIWPGRAQV
jgi:hypothetical protein